MLLCSGRHSRTPQSAQLKQQKCIFSKSWGLEVLDQGVVSPKTSLPGLQITTYSLGSHMVFPPCSYVPAVPLSIQISSSRHQPDWLRAHLTASLQRNHLMKGSASKRSSHPEFLVIRAPMYAFREDTSQSRRTCTFQKCQGRDRQREAEDQKLKEPQEAWQGSTMCAPGPDPRPERLVFFCYKGC